MILQWGYKRAFLRCALLFVVGAVLQLVLGDFDNGFLRYPWGLIFAINYLYLLLLVYVQGSHTKSARPPKSISTIARHSSIGSTKP